MTTAKEYIQSTFETVKARNGHEAEFLQAVEEFLSTLEPVFEKHPEYCLLYTSPLKELVNKEVVKTRLFQMLNHTQNSFALRDKVAISNFNIIAYIHSR